MSERNGDKARFQRQRKRKILHRMRIRELRKALAHNKPLTEARRSVQDSMYTQRVQLS